MQERKVKIISTVLDFIVWLFIFLWIYAAVSKLIEYQTFTVQLGQSPMLTPVAGFVAWFIPLTELLLSILLVNGRTMKYGMYGSFFLILLFTLYIVAITRFSDYIPCSCGGILEKMSWSQHLVFNIGFVLLAVAGILLESKKYLLQQVRNSRKPE